MVPSLVQGPEAPRARTDRHGTLGVGLGLGLGEDIVDVERLARDVATTHGVDKMPRLRLTGEAATLAAALGVASWAVSLAHEGRTAVVTASGGPLP